MMCLCHFYMVEMKGIKPLSAADTSATILMEVYCNG
jgi:hypothetical protein